MHRDLLRLRREDAVFGGAAVGVDGAVLGDEAFVLRFFGEENDDRLLLVNLGLDLNLNPAPEPLLAPPKGRNGEFYGRAKTRAMEGRERRRSTRKRWFLPGHAAMALCPRRCRKKILAASSKGRLSGEGRGRSDERNAPYSAARRKQALVHDTERR